MKSFYPKNQTSALRYLDLHGTGTPLIFLHGLGCASSFEYPNVATAPALKGKRCILVDFYGSGYSDSPRDFDYRVDTHAQTIFELVEHLGFDKIDLYGHSMGGTIAIEAATLLGSRVKHLALSESNLDRGGGQFSQNIASVTEEVYLHQKHGETIEHASTTGNIDWAITVKRSNPKAIYYNAKSLVKGTASDWRDLFYKHPAMKTYIFGERSLPDPDMEVLVDHGINIEVVQRAGHSMGLENPEGLATAIMNALA